MDVLITWGEQKAQACPVLKLQTFHFFKLNVNDVLKPLRCPDTSTSRSEHRRGFFSFKKQTGNVFLNHLAPYPV